MEETLERIQNWMKEARFLDAQKAVETLLVQNSKPSYELLHLYAQVLLEQKKTPDARTLISLAEHSLDSDVDQSIHWLSMIHKNDETRFRRELQFLHIQIADKKGRVDSLHTLLSSYQIYLFEKKNPAVPSLIQEMIEKYFKGDFNLRLQHLSLSFLRYDFELCEKIIKELILSSVEKASTRGIKDKVTAIATVMDATDYRGYLDVYRGLCTILLEGFKEKSSLKKMAEIIIYSDDFRIQTLLLNILHHEGLEELAYDYAPAVRSNPDYDFVYFEKYYVQLKKYFVQPREKIEKEVEVLDVDLTLESTAPKFAFLSPLMDDEIDESSRIIQLFKYNDLSHRELFEIATSFLQSEMPKVAIKAVEKILESELDDTTFMKASYLKLTCLLLVGDNRSALDCAHTSLDRAGTKDDILSFLYGEAEAYIRLGQKRDAKRVLKEIISIDANYRLTRERLEKLDEI